MPDVDRIRDSAVFLVLYCGKDAEFTSWPFLSLASNFQPPSTEKRAESFYVDILLVENSAPMRRARGHYREAHGVRTGVRGPEQRRSFGAAAAAKGEGGLGAHGHEYAISSSQLRGGLQQKSLEVVRVDVSSVMCLQSPQTISPSGELARRAQGGYLTKVELSSEINR